LAADPATLTQISCSPSYGPWLTAGAILLSAGVGAAVALLSIGAQRAIARKRATLDLLSQKEWDKDYITAKNEFNKLRDSPSGLAMWAADEHKHSEQLNIIRNTLNDYELIAVGIREGILDEALYRRWFKPSLIKDWTKAKEFVQAIRVRENTELIFCEFEWLAEKWIAEDQPMIPGLENPSQSSQNG